jgi:4-alpha-glucanotransferase
VPRAIQPLHDLAAALGVHTHYTDGLGRHVAVAPETLVSVCAAVGAAIARPEDAAEALRHHQATRQQAALPPAAAAWEGVLHPLTVSSDAARSAELHLEDGTLVPLRHTRAGLGTAVNLPWGYHRLTIERPGGVDSCTVIAAPERSWRRPEGGRSWGVGAHLAACRSGRSRSLGDLRDLDALVRWVRGHGGDLVTLLPLLPTFNAEPAEPSPYSPVSRLFWSELFLDLGEAHRPSPAPQRLDVTRADAEVRAALAGYEEPEASSLDEELLHYARFRGAQRRMGRNWRDWPGAARSGTLTADQVDGAEERFHLIAQTLARRQLRDVRQRVEREGARLGLDLAVGVHPDGYDPWSRQALFADGMSVGAPPDAGFPSGQDWGFSPVLPERSRREGHQYIARSIAHQAELAGVLRIDHIMAWTRLYWIPHGFGLHEGTYVSYPADELFAVLTLESHRHRCEIVGENLGTVPREIDEALPRHGIRGMYLVQFEAAKEKAIEAPPARDIALIGTHDTPTLAGWVAGNDIAERVQYGLLSKTAAPHEREARAAAVQALAAWLTCDPKEPAQLLAALLERLGGSASSLVIPWVEDLWFEHRAVNLRDTLITTPKARGSRCDCCWTSSKDPRRG